MLLAAAAGQAAPAEHNELEAALEADFGPPPGHAPRTFNMHFNYPAAPAKAAVPWRLALHKPDGRLLRECRGKTTLGRGPRDVKVRWRPPAGLPSGVYQLRLRTGGSGGDTQRRPLAVGSVPPLAPSLAPGPAAAGAWRVVLGNLHSQTSHSDGGGALDDCHGAQDPQSGTGGGPAEAYAFAQRHGLDFLLASEHNHMYDGSDGSPPDANADAARALYRQGLAQAAAYTAAHPGFVALYGLEWGVIANGGHLNILGSDKLLGWERNAAGELIGDEATPKGDYAALYRLMRTRSWTGQFNHPSSGQFNRLAFTADGDAAMALCEVMNSSAFSRQVDESESRLIFFEDACNRLLEAGYHLAFSSNQDNHCANWGASYGNRTGILLPAGEAPTQAALLAAIRARRVFATMDRGAQLMVSANGRLMGERFDNTGPLAFDIRYSSTSGRSVAALDIMEGVPGRQGEVQRHAGAETVFTPAPGPHFYYVRITQDDGRQLWSAPLWVNQLPGQLP